MTRVLITGASGFIGANLARRLLRDGHEVHVVLRESHQQWRIQDISGELSLHRLRLEGRVGLRNCLKTVRPDWVFNLAAYGNSSTQTNVDEMVATNLTGCIGLVEESAEAGVQAFIQAGSSSEYGYQDKATQEDQRIDPNSYYAITKAAATHACQLTARTHDFNAITLRFYSIYGPWEDPSRLIPTLVDHGMKGKLPPLVSPRIARDFVYVDDAIDAMIRVASMKAPARGAIYNVCSGIQTDLESVVATVCRLMNIREEPTWSSMPPRPWDTNAWFGSPALMTKEVGWTAKTTLETGLKRTIEWMGTRLRPC